MPRFAVHPLSDDFPGSGKLLTNQEQGRLPFLIARKMQALNEECVTNF
jgi:hypothetical protein